MPVEIDHIKSLFNPSEVDQRIVEEVPGRSLRDYLPEEFPRDGSGVVVYNDREIEGWELGRIIPKDGDSILLSRVPGDPATGTAILVSVLISAASYAIQAFTAPEPPKNRRESPTENFSGFQTTRGEGVPIPFCYGEVRAAGHLLQTFERQVSGEQVEEGTTTLFTDVSWCHGPVEEISDVRVGAVPVEDLFGVEVENRLGEHDQAHIDGFDDSARLVGYGLPVRNDEGPVTVTTQREVEAVEVILRFPAGLLRTRRAGNRRPHSETFDVAWREFGSNAPFRSIKKTVTAKTQSPFKSIVRIDNLDLARYQIRITRETEDDTGNSALSSESELFAIQEITHEETAHVGLAHTGLRQIPSAQLTQVPQEQQYSAKLKGARNLRIYSDEFTYTIGYSDNPMVCAADFITNRVWGMGRRYSWDNIDIPSLLEAMAYCDQQVPDGRGGFHKRATIGRMFDSEEDGQSVLQVFRRVSGVIIVLEGTQWRFLPDRAEDMVWIAGAAEIYNGTLKYKFLDKSRLANRVSARYLDSENDYIAGEHFEELPQLEQGDPVNSTRRDMFGITRTAQVSREVNRFLNQNRLGGGEEVEFEAGLSSLRVTAGRVFGVTIINASIGIASGKILHVDDTNTVLTLDEPVTLEEGKDYEIWLQHPANDTRDRRIITSPASQVIERVIVSDANWSTPDGKVARGTTYGIGELESSVQKFRARGVTVADVKDGLRRVIQAIKYDEGVYSDDLTVEPSGAVPSIPPPGAPVPLATDLRINERLVQTEDGTLQVVVDLDWAAPVSAVLRSFEVWYRALDDGLNAWVVAGQTSANRSNFELVDLESPNVAHEAAVLSTDVRGRKTSIQEAPRISFVTEGVTDQPPNLAGLVGVLVQGTLILSVNPLPIEDLGSAGRYVFRIGSPGSVWEDASLFEEVTAVPRVEVKNYPHGDVTILAKARNGIGNESPDAAQFSITLRGDPSENVVLTRVEGPAWTGLLENFTQSPSNHLEMTETLASVAPAPRRYAPGRARRFGPGAPNPRTVSVPTATYTTDPIEVSSAGAVLARPDVYVDWSALSLLLGTWSDQAGKDFAAMDVPWTGLAGGSVRLVVESRTSIVDQTDLLGQPWAPHVDRGEYPMLWIQFRVRVTVAEPESVSAVVRQITITIDVPDKLLDGSVSVPSATAVSHDYPTDFFVEVTALQLSVLGGDEGDTAQLISEDKDGFVVAVSDKDGALTTGTVSFLARGR